MRNEHGRLKAAAVAVTLGMAAAAMSPASVFAQTFPAKPVRLIVPYAPGGATDIIARMVGQKMSAAFGQPFVVENVGGAGAIVGAERAAKAPNDGYTLLVGTSTALSTNPLLYKKLPYKVEDFAPITLLVTHPFVFGMHPGIPANTVKELVAYAKTHVGKINYATTGRGSASHIVGEMVEAALGIDMVDVPYKGASPALTDLVGGQVQMFFDGITTTLPFYRSGKLRILAVTSEQRNPAAPDVPTVVESGYPNLVIYNRYALFAPAGTPRAVIDRLNDAAVRALNTEDVRARMIADGSTADPTTPEGLAAILKSDAEVWGRTIRTLGIQLD